MYNLDEITSALSTNIAHAMDSVVGAYVRAAVDHLTLRGEDITEYTLIMVPRGPDMQDAEMSWRLGYIWRVVKIEEIEGNKISGVTFTIGDRNE